MFVTPAFAQAAPGAGGGGDLLLTLMPFIAIFAIMYFLIIRPQRQKMKAHDEMVKALRRGDTIVTSGGLIGKIARVVDDNEIQVDLAESVRVRLLRTSILEVRTKGEPAKD
ncbi:MAG: preprotein translocase subunit YajC [Hyphomicrobiales bacterium]|nr:preprotein translocase subunit YajC [Hyphomicrobiales bacterium]